MSEKLKQENTMDAKEAENVQLNLTATKVDEIPPFEKTVWLSSPTMHGEELQYMTEAFETNWMSTIGKNIDASNGRLVN